MCSSHLLLQHLLINNQQSWLSLQHTPLDKLDQKHFAKGSRGPEQNGSVVALRPSEDAKEIALMEAKTNKMCDLLHEILKTLKTTIMNRQIHLGQRSYS
ncbi:hypothetical protein ACS0TY_018782 [Phlomoides rotata]